MWVSDVERIADALWGDHDRSGDAQVCGYCHADIGALAGSLVAAVARAAPRRRR